MHVDLLSISYLCQSGYEDWVLPLTQSVRLRPHLQLSEPSLPYPRLLAPPRSLSFICLSHSASQMTTPKHQLPSFSARAFLPLLSAPVALGTDAHLADRWSQPWPLSPPAGTPKESDEGRRGWGVWCVYAAEESGECCFVTMVTSPRFLWTAFRPAQGPWMKTNSIGITARGPKRPRFSPPNGAGRVFVLIIWQKLSHSYLEGQCRRQKFPLSGKEEIVESTHSPVGSVGWVCLNATKRLQPAAGFVFFPRMQTSLKSGKIWLWLQQFGDRFTALVLPSSALFNAVSVAKNCGSYHLLPFIKAN